MSTWAAIPHAYRLHVTLYNMDLYVYYRKKSITVAIVKKLKYIRLENGENILEFFFFNCL